MHIDSLEALFIDEMRDAYSAESQILKVLPKMARAAAAPQLKDALEAHVKTTQKHIDRLEDIFEAYKQSPKGKECKGMAGLVSETNELVEHEMPAPVKDAALLTAAQRIEHYEMASYGSLRSFAQVLGDMTSAGLLQKTLEEEGFTDRELTQLALWKVNLRARDLPIPVEGLRLANWEDGAL
jgi:ferritin-like metal-binding protein YciE